MSETTICGHRRGDKICPLPWYHVTDHSLLRLDQMTEDERRRVKAMLAEGKR